jgi:hypothetical protein
MILRTVFTTPWSNVDVAESGFAGVTVPPVGALVEKEFGGLFLAASGRFCGPGWLGVFWLNLPWLPGELFAGFSDGVVGVAAGEAAAAGEAGAADGGGGVATPGLAPE